FGIENPGRVQLIQFADAITLAPKIAAPARGDLAPDYLLWGYPERRDSTVSVLQGRDNLFGRITTLLPNQRYRNVAIVSAPPYGSARIYGRIAASAEGVDELPAVSIYDPVRHQWLRRVQPVVADFAPAVPVEFRVGYSIGPPTKADRSVAT